MRIPKERVRGCIIGLEALAVAVAMLLVASESLQGSEWTELNITGIPTDMVFVPASETRNPRLAVVATEGDETWVTNFVQMTDLAQFFPEDPILVRLSSELSSELDWSKEEGIEVGVPVRTPSGWNVTAEERFFDDGDPVYPGSITYGTVYRLEIGGDEYVGPLDALLIPRSPYIFAVEISTGFVSLLNMDLAGLADPSVIGSGNNLFFDPPSYELIEKAEEIVQFPRDIVSMVAEDFNGDGAADLAVAARHGFYILPGNDKGHFLTPTALRIFEDDPTMPLDYDLERGRREALSELMSLKPIYRAAEADFQATAAQYPTAVTAADLTNDGVLDLVLLKGGPQGGLAIPLIGRGNGTFVGLDAVNDGQSITCPTYQACLEPQSVAAGDFTENGWPDLAIAGASELVLLPALGGGRFGSPRAVGALAADSGDPPRLVVDDFDRDGCLDIAVSNVCADTVDVYRGRGDGSFHPVCALSLPVGAMPSELIAEDFDRSGNSDLAAACVGISELAIFLHDEDCAFALWAGAVLAPEAPVALASDGPNLAVLSGGGAERVLAEIDRTPQGVPSGMARNQEERAVPVEAYVYDVYSGNGDGTFAAPRESRGRQAPLPTSIAASGDDPSASGRWIVAYFGYPENESNAEDGGVNGFEFPDAVSDQLRPSAVAAGSLNGTGVNDDVVIADYAGDRLYVFFDGTRVSPLTYPTSGHPLALAIGDFNGDELDDVAALCRSSNVISVWYGSADEPGLSDPVKIYADSGFPISLATGDFDGDGATDLCAAYFSSNHVVVWRGTGDRQFEHWGAFCVGEGPVSVTAGDFNGDGRADIATANYIDNSVSILWNVPSETGDLAFEEQVVTAGRTYSGTPAEIGGGPIAITTFEVDDGSLWLAVAVEIEKDGGPLLLIDPESPITFIPPVIVPPGEYAVIVDVAVGDFDNDYIEDVALLIEDPDGNRSIATILAPGFPYAAASVSSVQSAFTSIEALDLDGDSLLDLAATNTAANEVAVLWGRGDGAFAEDESVSYETSVAPTAVAGLGEVGFVVVSTKVEVFLPVRGSPQGFEPSFLEVGETPGCIAIGELNGDGFPDLIVADPVQQRLLMFSGSELAGGAPTASVVSPVSSVWVGGLPSGILIDEARGGLYPRIVVTLADRSEILVLHGAADYSFEWGESIPVGASPSALTGTDFDGDGRTDLVVCNAGSRDLTFLKGVETGDFAVELRSPVRLASIPNAVVAADFSGNGTSDVLIAYEGSSYVTILYDTTDGASGVEVAGVRIDAGVFESLRPAVAPSSVSAALPSSPEEPDTGSPLARTVGFLHQGQRRLTAVTLDSDPFPDIVLTDHETHVLSILLGSGDRDDPFSPAQTAAVSGCSRCRPAIGDLDGDGQLDIAVASPHTNEVIVFWAGARLDPSTVSALPTGVTPVCVASDDLNGDGVDDLVAFCQGSLAVYVYISRGGGQFAMETLELPGPPGGAAIADINNDGLGDLIVSDLLGDQLTLLCGDLDGEAFSFSVDSVALPQGTLATAILAGDLDKDGGIDLLVLSSGEEAAYVLYNRNYGRFDRQVVQLPGVNAMDAILCDLDVDGYPDLVVVDPISAVLLIYRNLNGESFEARPAVCLVSGEPYAVASEDFDGDGNPDLVVTTTGGDLLVFWGAEGRLPTEIAHRLDFD